MTPENDIVRKQIFETLESRQMFEITVQVERSIDLNNRY